MNALSNFLSRKNKKNKTNHKQLQQQAGGMLIKLT